MLYSLEILNLGGKVLKKEQKGVEKHRRQDTVESHADFAPTSLWPL